MRLLSFALLLFCAFPCMAQLGVRNFEFLNKSANASVVGLGGINTTVSQGDVNMSRSNPALLDTSMIQKLSLNYHQHYAQVPMTNIAYAHQFKKLGILGFGLTYLNYGKMEETDPSGNVLGTFSANEYALSISKSFHQDAFSFGVQMQYFGSQIASYHAMGLAFDLGTTYRHPDKDMAISVVLRHMGFGLKSYTGASIKLPFDAQVGFSIRPQKMPFRFSITAHHLHNFKLAYDDPKASQQLLSTNQKLSFADELSRHFVLGTEVLISKAFQLRLGYNRQVSKDLGLAEASRGAGLSFGVNLKLRSYEFAYTRALRHIAGGKGFVTISKDFR